LLRELLFVENIHILLTDMDGGGSILRRATESDRVSHHEGADGETVVVEGVHYGSHGK
jgi:hypothetical protein